MARILPTKRPINRRYIGDKTNFSPKNRRKFARRRAFQRVQQTSDFSTEKSEISDFSPKNRRKIRFLSDFSSSRVFHGFFFSRLTEKTIFLRFFGEKFRNFCPCLLGNPPIELIGQTSNIIYWTTLRITVTGQPSEYPFYSCTHTRFTR